MLADTDEWMVDKIGYFSCVYVANNTVLIAKTLNMRQMASRFFLGILYRCVPTWHACYISLDILASVGSCFFDHSML